MYNQKDKINLYGRSLKGWHRGASNVKRDSKFAAASELYVDQWIRKEDVDDYSTSNGVSVIRVCDSYTKEVEYDIKFSGEFYFLNKIWEQSGELKTAQIDKILEDVDNFICRVSETLSFV